MIRIEKLAAMLSASVALACLIQEPAIARESENSVAAEAASQSSVVANEAGDPASLEELGLDFKRYQLDNGLTVILNKAKGAQDVYVEVVYRVGSKDEPAGRSGFAHLFEHLMFQGTANRKGEYFEALEGFGAIDINGTTSQDRTNFYQVVAPGALDRVLWLESDRMQHLMGGVTQEELDSQRAVVKNEKREGEVNGSFADEVQLLRAYYPEGHPYGHSVIGSMEDLDAATLDDVADWYKRYYGAANAILLVSGDIDFDQVSARIEHYFADVDAGRRVPTIDQWVPVRESVGRLKSYDDVESPSVRRTWPMPNNDARDTILISAFIEMLDARADDLPITKRLIEEEKLLAGLGWSVVPAEVASEFEVSFDIAKGISYEAALARFEEEFAELLRTKLEASDIAKYVEGKRAEFLMYAVEPMAVPAMLLDGELMHDDPLAFRNHLEIVANAAPEDFTAAALRWMTLPYFEQLTLPAAKTEDRASEADQPVLVDRSAMPPVDLARADQVFPDVAIATLSGGAKLVVVQLDDHPVFEAAINFDLGQGFSNELSTDFMLGFMNFAGVATTNLSPKQLDERSKDLQASIFPSFSETGFEYRFNGISSRAEEVFDLAADIIKNPLFDPEAIKKDNDEMSKGSDEAIKVSIDANQLMRMALWGVSHPHGKLPEARAHEPLSHSALRAFHESGLRQSNMTIYLAGDISLEDARRMLEDEFVDWRATSGLEKAGGGMPAPDPLTPRIILLDKPGAAQSQVMAARLISPYDSDAAPAERMANAPIGGGFISRINLNLREDKGWSYGAKTSLDQNADGPQTLLVAAQVETEKTAPSMAEILRELNEYTSVNPVTEEEFQLARNNYLAELRSFNLTPSAVLEMLIQADVRNAPYDYLTGLPRRYEALTLEDVRQVANELYDPASLTWVIEGDISVIEGPIRALDVAPIEVRNQQGEVIR
jgi:zinc protease